MDTSSLPTPSGTRSAAHRGLTDAFARYAAGNLDPAHAYQEGAAFPASGVAAELTLSTGSLGTGAGRTRCATSRRRACAPSRATT